MTLSWSSLLALVCVGVSMSLATTAGVTSVWAAGEASASVSASPAAAPTGTDTAVSASPSASGGGAPATEGGEAATGPAYTFGLMMDAGSSGTRLYIYKWLSPLQPVVDDDAAKGKKEGETAPTVSVATADPGGVPTVANAGSDTIEQKEWSLKIKPGISEHASDPAGVVADMTQLIDYAKAQITDAATWPYIRIFLKSTAGMRLVKERDAEESDAVFTAIRDFLENDETCPFAFERQDAIILPGEDEGAFGWLTANFLFNKVGDHAEETALAAAQKNDHSFTVAALDLGGASTQISFVPAEVPLNSHFPLVIGRHRYPLYTHSYLRAGVDYAVLRYNNYLISSAAANGGGQIVSPCAWKGRTYEQQAVDDVTGKTVSDNKHNIEGVPDADKCLAAVKSTFFEFEAFCSTGPCSFDGVYQAKLPPLMKIVAFSAYYYVGKAVGCVGDTTPGCFKRQLQDLCQTQSWDDVKKAHPKSAPDFTYEMNVCFKAAYVYTLLTTGYHLADDRAITIAATDETGKNELSWTLGAMIYEAELINSLALPASSAHTRGAGVAAADCSALEARLEKRDMHDSIGMFFAGFFATMVISVGVMHYCIKKQHLGRKRGDMGFNTL